MGADKCGSKYFDLGRFSLHIHTQSTFTDNQKEGRKWTVSMGSALIPVSPADLEMHKVKCRDG